MNSSTKVFILSPHFDDAAYGLTTTIATLLQHKVQITLINCFTITKWTAIPVEDKSLEAVSALRAAEDREYNELFNSAINIINLDLLDAPLRNGYIFQNQSFQSNELELIDQLEKQLFDRVGGGILLCPLAIGSHIDHSIAREAVIRIYKKLDILFFEDLPYAQRIGEDQIRRHVHALEEELDAKLVSRIIKTAPELIDKEKAIHVYQSQINDEISSEIIAHLKALGGERLWGEDRLLSMFNE